MIDTISVVVASAAGGEYLFQCLSSLRAQTNAGPHEIIVVDGVGTGVTERVARDYPGVQLISAGEELHSLQQLRRIGVEAATGELVAVLEEHKIAPPHWIATIRDAFHAAAADAAARPLNAVGGPILDHGCRRIRDWVFYFTEYHNYLPPWVDGERLQLAGSNIAYRRAALLENREALDRGYWEVLVHPRLAAAGQMRAAGRMGVDHRGPTDFGHFIEQRYLRSRVWGGTQRATAGLPKRLFYLVAAPLFPFLLLARMTQRVLKSGRRIPKFLLALPLLVPVAVAYVWGEWLGYLLGPGDALERVE